MSGAYSHFTECSSSVVIRTKYRGTKPADASHIVLCSDSWADRSLRSVASQLRQRLQRRFRHEIRERDPTRPKPLLRYVRFRATKLDRRLSARGRVPPDDFPIPDIQLENSRDFGKGLKLTLTCLSRPSAFGPQCFASVAPRSM